MIRFTVSSINETLFPLTPAAKEWLEQSHLPTQFAKGLELVKRTREYFGYGFDPAIRQNQTGRVHVVLHPTDWQLPNGIWVAGFYQVGAGPWEPADGGNYTDLIEASWEHEYSLHWDTLEHEFSHMIEYRMKTTSPSAKTDWQNMGHGQATLDPYARMINYMVLDAYPPTQAYFPGLIGNAYTMQSMKRGEKTIVSCGGAE